MPYQLDSHGNMAWFNNGQFFYPDENGDLTLGATQYYANLQAAQDAALAQTLAAKPELTAALAAVPAANLPIEGGQYFMTQTGGQGFQRVTFRAGMFYDNQKDVDVNGNVLDSYGPGGVVMDPTGCEPVKIGDYANTGISFPNYSTLSAAPQGGDSTSTLSPGVTVDLRTPAQLAEDMRKSAQFSASSGFDKFMQTVVVGTLAAIGTAGVASELAPAGDAAGAGGGSTGVITPADVQLGEYAPTPLDTVSAEVVPPPELDEPLQLAGPGSDAVAAPVAPVDELEPVQLSGPTGDAITPADVVTNAASKAGDAVVTGAQKGLTSAVVAAAAKILNPPKAAVVTPPRSSVITPGAAAPTAAAPATNSAPVLVGLALLALKFL